jgi:hypothetical protein
MNAQALTVPIRHTSAPALLAATVGTAAVVSLAVLVVDERTDVSPARTTVPVVADAPQTPGEAYAEQLEQRRHAYLESLRIG